MAYRPGRQLTSVEDARAILSVHGEPVMRVERVAIEAADQRVLAGDLIASHDVPPFARSMMDGYAVRAADTAGATREQPVRLRLVETIYTGRAPVAAVVAGTCSGIATGAPLPDGADAVVIVEHTSREGNQVLVSAAVAPRQHVGRAGSDLVAGEVARRRRHGADARAAWRRRRAGARGGGRLPAAQGRDSLDGRRDRRSGRHPRPGADLRLQHGRADGGRFDFTAASRWWLRASATTARR